MGITGHLALAFRPSDKTRIMALLAGEGEVGDEAAIAYQPNFDLTREDAFAVHRALEALADSNPELAPVGTIVVGIDPVAEAGMSIQHFHTAEALRTMAKAYDEVIPETLNAAIEKIRPEFDSGQFAAMPGVIAGKFATIRRELSVVADGGWAMISGMY